VSRPVKPRPAPLPRAQTEKEWGRTVHDYAVLRRWEWYHPWLSVRSTPGWPDVSLVRPPRFVVVELKRETGKVTPSQEHWLGLLRQCPGVEVFVWRPSDWPEVLEVLL
jgi:hypothetical protein